MLIALDYDGTYTADPKLWLEFIKLAKSKGHKVVCATMRYDHEVQHIIDPKLREQVDIINTGHKAKKDYLSKKGIKPNIWIDDNPNWVHNDA